MGLRAALAVNGEWDEEQCSLARDLLAIRLELRHAGDAIATGTDAAALAALCQREVDRLQELLENTLLALDDGARAMAMSGMPGEEDPDSKKHRKYENSARREYEQAQADLLASQAYRAGGIADPTPAPAAAAPTEMGPDSDFEPEPETEPETETSELEMLRSKLDSVLPETEAAFDEQPADATPIGSVEVKPAVEPVSPWISRPFCRKLFPSRVTPRWRRQRNRAAIAASVAPRRTRPARRLSARAHEFDWSTERPLGTAKELIEQIIESVNCTGMAYHSPPFARGKNSHSPPYEGGAGGEFKRRDSPDGLAQQPPCIPPS